MQEYFETLGNVIRDARSKKGLTQSELAEMVGVVPRTILDIENHRGNPRFNVLIQIIQVLKIPADLIFHPNGNQSGDVIESLLSEFSKCNNDDRKLVASVMTTLFSELKKSRDRIF